MKLNEAQKVAEIIQAAKDQHQKITADYKIRAELCEVARNAFPEFDFRVSGSGEVSVEKIRLSTDSFGRLSSKIG